MSDDPLDLLEEWYDLWFNSQDMQAKLPKALHVRTAITLTEAGRAIAMSDWVPGQGGRLDCPKCGSTRRNARHVLFRGDNVWPDAGYPCDDPWHGPAPTDNGPGAGADPPCSMIE